MSLTPEQEAIVRQMNDDFRKAVTLDQISFSREIKSQPRKFLESALAQIKEAPDFAQPESVHRTGVAAGNIFFEIYYRNRAGEPFLDPDLPHTKHKMLVRFCHEF